MSRRRCCYNNNSCAGLDCCTVLPTLLILQSSGLLCNDRAYILVLLGILCGGYNACGCNNGCCC